MKSVVTFCSLLISSAVAPAASINFSTTSAAGWTVTGGGAVNATPFVVKTNVSPGQGMPAFLTTGLSLTSTAETNGTFVSGGSFANFDGYWIANFSFMLPSDANNVSLVFSNFYADDRALLTLNGNTITGAGIIDGHNDPTGGPSGYIVLTDGGPLTPYTFAGPDGSVSGSTTSGFNIGGLNTLELIVNNTQTGIYGPNEPYGGGPHDQTIFALDGAITYAPEPSACALVLLAAACWRGRRGQSNGY